MTFLTKSLLTAIGLAAPVLAKKYQALWTKNDFITADLGGGNQVDHKIGFTIYDDNGYVAYFDDTPFGYSPSVNGFTQYDYSGGCFGDNYYGFLTQGDFQGYPLVCEVRAFDNCPLATADGDGDLYFFGLGAGQSGYCSVQWDVPDDLVCTGPDPTLGQERYDPAPPVCG